ncbi:MAG: AMP-binding protein [Lachnospiraceae bacterium]|nr:AMP-binding protein [Lachnospiraceae bacterium]
MQMEKYLDTVIYDDFSAMLKGRYEESSRVTALRYFEKENIVDVTYSEMVERVAAVYEFLKKEGLGGKHIAILSENRYEYIIIYLAAVLDSVIVPLDREAEPSVINELFERFDVSAVFVTDKTAKKAGQVSEIKKYNIDREFRDILKTEISVERFFEETKDTDKDRFAVLASTSGTDGRMKGVMLTQYNVITNIRGTLENNVLKSPTLSFLPMHHTYGFNPCILATLYNGTTLCINRDVKKLFRDIKAFDPFFFGAVPMVIEGIYDNILREAGKQNKERSLKRLIRLSNALRKVGIDLRHRFFGSIITPGLRLVVSGGAPLRREYVDKFDEIGITILNGYGLTECSPTVAVSRTINNVPGSAGTIMKNIEVKVAEDGELLVRGPNVMLGYYKDKEATRDAMEDGYFKTGDIGYTLGRIIFITGRKKNLIITENGENIAPEYLEAKINSFDEVEESLVVSKRVNNVSIVCAKVYMGENGKQNVQRFKEDLKALNESLPSYMRIDDYEVMPEAFQKNSSKKIIRKLYL